MSVVRDYLADLAAAHPRKTAVVEGDRVLDFEEFNREVNRWANALLGLGVVPGEKVLWVGENSLEVVVLVNAIRKTGAVGVPMNYRLTTEEAGYVIDNSDAAAVVFDVDQASQVEGLPASCGNVRHWVRFRCGPGDGPAWAECMTSLVEKAADEEPERPGDDPGLAATMIYTSGTTGKPKGALRTRQDPAVSGALVSLVGWQPDDVYITTGPLYHSGPLGFMAIAQRLGGSVVVLPKFDPVAWLTLVDRHRVTTTFSAPTPVRRIVDLPEEVRRRYDTSSLARVIANAAPWPFELKRKYVEAFGDTSLWEVYGSTELGVNTVLAPADQMRKPGSCGRPAPLVDIKLFDESGEEVTEPNVPGELFVRSGSTFDTYYKDPDKFAKIRRGDFLSVGDVAYRDDEGFYYICDRKSDMIISGGVNIYPAEIEAVLVAHPAVADAAVFGIPSEEWGESVHAAVSLYPGAEADDAELQEFCRGHLAGYKVPRSFDRLAEIPRTPSGKILKRELRAPYWQAASG